MQILLEGMMKNKTVTKGYLRRTGAGLLSGVLLFLLSASLGPAQVPTGITPKADRILKKACEQLRSAESFSFQAEITFDEIIDSGQKLQYSGSLNAAVRRPDRFRTEYRGDLHDSVIWFDGKSLTLMSPSEKLYATAPAPLDIDSILDMTMSELGFSVPLSDLLYSDPYMVLLNDVTGGFYLGVDTVNGVACHHVALQQDDIDWQIWFEDAERLVPRKITITYKKLPGSPQYTAILSDWKFSPPLTDRFFSFEPPEGAEEIDFLPAAEVTGGRQ